MYLVCINCGEKNHLSLWTLVIKAKNQVLGTCPICIKKNIYNIRL